MRGLTVAWFGIALHQLAASIRSVKKYVKSLFIDL